MTTSASTLSNSAVALSAVAGLAGLIADERVLADVSVLGLIIGLLPLGRSISEDQVLH